MIYPTGLTNYFRTTDIEIDSGRVLILSGPIVVKSFACNQIKGDNTDTGSFKLKLFDGSVGDEIFRVYTGIEWGGTAPRMSFLLPLNGIRVLDSLMLEFVAVGNYSGATVGISVLYQR